MADRWTDLTNAVSQAITHRDRVARDVDSYEAQLRRREAELLEADQILRDRIAALHAEFPELWRFDPTHPDGPPWPIRYGTAPCVLACREGAHHCPRPGPAQPPSPEPDVWPPLDGKNGRAGGGTSY